MSNMWASKFKSKEEKAVQDIEDELKALALEIKSHEAEILAGAPLKSFQGVRILKNALEMAIRRQGVLERKRAKITDQATGRNK